MSNHSKVIILGSGPAGCTAAIYAARAMLEPTLISGIQPGGQLTITTEVENYPGFADAIQGPWLMDQMQKQAEHLGTKFVSDTIASVDLSRRPFTLKGDSGEIYTTDALIIATGASANWLGLASESKFQGFGVSACATCDGFFFRGKTGGGGGRRQYRGGGSSVPHQFRRQGDPDPSPRLPARRQDQPGPADRQQERSRSSTTPKWRKCWAPSQPKGVTGIKLRNTVTGSRHEIGVDGLFVAIGHSPATELFKGKLDMDESGYIKTAPDSTHTSVAGVFAAGDVKDKVFRQAVTAAGMGCMAALEAERFLAASHGGDLPLST